jgi:hypothetical protein
MSKEGANDKHIHKFFPFLLDWDGVQFITMSFLDNLNLETCFNTHAQEINVSQFPV